MMGTNSDTTKPATKTKMEAVKKKIEKLNNDCSWLELKIKGDEHTLKQSISGINTSCPINRNEYWISLFNNVNVEATFEAVYKDIVKFKDATVAAFKAGFYNSTETLKLLQKVADYELDLYKIVDESELTSTELSEMLTAVLDDSNTTDDVVFRLLEQAKQRALRLRERFESFRNEFDKELNDKYGELQASISQQNSRIDSITKQYTEFSSKASKIDALKTEIEKSIKNLSKRIGEIQASISQQKYRIDCITEQNKESTSKTNSRIDALKTEIEKSINNNNNLNKRIGDQGVSIHNQKERLEKVSMMSDGINKMIKTWVILGSVLTFALSLVGSILIHHFL